jgi:hypothetical protein
LYTIKLIKLQAIVLAGHVIYIGERRNAYILSKYLNMLDPLEYLGADGRILLKVDRKQVGYEDVDWILLALDWDQWQAVSNSNELWVTLKSGEIFGQLRVY